jgi:hypothetical protein
MKSAKTVSKILFYVTRLLSFFYFFITLLSIFALSTGLGLGFRENGKYFQVYYPFTKTPFLNGDNNSTYIIFYYLLPITLYALFFLLAGNVFKVFFQPRLFTANGVKHLKVFYLANLILPGLALVLTSIFAEVLDAMEILTAVHFILGVFVYFLAAIFKQGLNLQNQHDLII